MKNGINPEVNNTFYSKPAPNPSEFMPVMQMNMGQVNPALEVALKLDKQIAKEFDIENEKELNSFFDTLCV